MSTPSTTGSDLQVGLVVRERPYVDVLRTVRLPRRARALGHPRSDLGRPVEAVALDDGVAGEDLLGLRVRAVGHDGSTVAPALDPPGVGWSSETLAVDGLTGLDELARPLLHEGVHLGDRLWIPCRSIGRVADHEVVVLLRRVEHDDVPHGTSSALATPGRRLSPVTSAPPRGTG